MRRTAHPAPHGRLALALAAAAAAALVLTGCGSTTAAADGTTEITLSMQNPDVKTADPATWAIVQAFEKANPDIKVTVTGEAVAEHLQKLSIAAQSDTLPDIFWVYKSTAEQMQSANLLLDLAPVLDELGLTDSFPKSTIQNFSAGDVIYGVPYQGLLTGLWVNKKILADNGVEMPKTFDDLVAAAKTLSAKGITTISDGANQSSFSVWSFLTMLDRYGYEDKLAGLLDGSEKYTNDDFLTPVQAHRRTAQSRRIRVQRVNPDVPAGGRPVHQRKRGDARRRRLGIQRHPGVGRGQRHRLLAGAAVRRRRR